MKNKTIDKILSVLDQPTQFSDEGGMPLAQDDECWRCGARLPEPTETEANLGACARCVADLRSEVPTSEYPEVIELWGTTELVVVMGDFVEAVETVGEITGYWDSGDGSNLMPTARLREVLAAERSISADEVRARVLSELLSLEMTDWQRSVFDAWMVSALSPSRRA